MISAAAFAEHSIAFGVLHGIHEFIVGTGGRNLQNLGSVSTMPPTFVIGQGSSFGVLALMLRPGSYSWSFKTADGSPAFMDTGTASCH